MRRDAHAGKWLRFVGDSCCANFHTGQAIHFGRTVEYDGMHDTCLPFKLQNLDEKFSQLRNVAIKKKNYNEHVGKLSERAYIWYKVA